jgi:hypothetical protein
MELEDRLTMLLERSADVNFREREEREDKEERKERERKEEE